jgi:hypothetical protein
MRDEKCGEEERRREERRGEEEINAPHAKSDKFAVAM